MADRAAGAAIGGAGSLIGGGISAIGQGRENARNASAQGDLAKNLSDFISGNVLNRSYDAENRAINDSLAQTQGIINQQVMPSDTRGLEAQASRTLTQGSRALDSALASRGVFNSGAALAAQSGLASDTLGNLAGQINQDQFNRAQLASTLSQNQTQLRQNQQQMTLGDELARAGLAGQLFSNDAFGFYDPKTGIKTNQGK